MNDRTTSAAPARPGAFVRLRAGAAAALALALGGVLAGAAPARAQTPPSPTPTLPPPGPPSVPNTPPQQPTGTPPGGAPITAPGGVSANAAPGANAGAVQGPLTLGAAARLAAAQSANSEAARFRITQARARVTQSRSELLPTVSGLLSQNARTFNTASFGISFPAPAGQRPLFDPNGQVAGPVNIYDARARLAANLFDVAAVGRLRASQTLVRAGQADADNQAQLAAGSAASAYLRAQRAEAQLGNRAADSALAAELVTIADQQLRAGTGVGLDVTRARSQFAGTRAQLIAARGERDRARLDLARALGVPLDTRVTLADTLAAPPAGVPTDEAVAVNQALERRADLRTAAEQLAAARQQASAIRAERLPSVQAFVDDGSTGKAVDRRLLNTYTYGVQVNVPIFDAFRRQGREQEQQAAISELDVRRRDLETQAAVDVRGSLVDLRSAAEQVGAARERLTLAEQEVTQARDRFRAGVAGNADVVTASQSLTAARTAYVDALSSYQSARVALARAQGAVTDLP